MDDLRYHKMSPALIREYYQIENPAHPFFFGKIYGLLSNKALYISLRMSKLYYYPSIL
jgi:hypothetical protein